MFTDCEEIKVPNLRSTNLSYPPLLTQVRDSYGQIVEGRSLVLADSAISPIKDVSGKAPPMKEPLIDSHYLDLVLSNMLHSLDHYVVNVIKRMVSEHY